MKGVDSLIKAVRSFFFAVDIDDRDLICKIRSFQDELASKGFAEVQLIKDLHITLNFLGKLQWGTINEMRTKLRKIHLNSFDVVLKDVKYFSSAKLPIRILWTGAEGSEIYNLMKRICDIISSGSVEEIPHVTVARVRKISNFEGLKKFIEQYKNYFFGSFHVNCFKLKANVGGKYVDVERYSLF